MLNLFDQVFILSAEEEINNMKIELEKYGIQMPAFSKIGGILANELSVDEAACKKWGLLKVAVLCWGLGSSSFDLWVV